LAEAVRFREDSINVEPCCGGGVIMRTIPGDWMSYDVRAVKYPGLGDHMRADFLKLDGRDPRVYNVITNPPYSLAEGFVRHSRKLYPMADLYFLLRMAFLASEKREGLYQDLGTPDLYVLPNRPDFTGEGGDSADYAWFHWPPYVRREGKIMRLNTTPKSERCK